MDNTGTIIILALLGVFFVLAVTVGYMGRKWLIFGMAPRSFKTELPREMVLAIFRKKVATFGWKIISEGEPTIAQCCNVFTIGRGQRIALHSRVIEVDVPHADSFAVTKVPMLAIMIAPEKWLVGIHLIRGGFAIRRRFNRFISAVRKQDPRIEVVKHPDILENSERAFMR